MSTLISDLEKVGPGMNLRTANELEQMCIHAVDREEWEKPAEYILYCLEIYGFCYWSMSIMKSYDDDVWKLARFWMD